MAKYSTSPLNLYFYKKTFHVIGLGDRAPVSPPNKFPSLVAIGQGHVCSSYQCSGVIISQDMVVTLRSCFFDIQHLDLDEVVAGERKLYDDGAEGTEQRRRVIKIIAHPDYV